MLRSNKFRSAVVALGFAAAGTIGTAALAQSVSSEIFVTVTSNEEALVNHDRVKFQTKGETTVRVQKLTFAPGSSTGWHHHPGLVIVAVASGSVTLRDENCGASTTYGPGLPAGAVFFEGHDHPHVATSSGGAVVYATYVDPTATFRVNDPAPCP